MKTIADYDREILQDPNDAEAYNNRGITHRNNGNYEQAISDLTKSIEINPNNIEPYYNRGLAYMNIEEVSKAFDDYDKVIQLDPKNAEAFAKRGLINSELGKIQEAINDFEEFLRLDPNNKNAKLVKDELEKLKSGYTSSSDDSYEEVLILKKEIKFILIGSIIGAVAGVIFYGLSNGGLDVGVFFFGIWAGAGLGGSINLVPSFFRKGKEIGAFFGVTGGTIGGVLGFFLWSFPASVGIIWSLIRILIKVSKVKKLQRND